VLTGPQHPAEVGVVLGDVGDGEVLDVAFDGEVFFGAHLVFPPEVVLISSGGPGRLALRCPGPVLPTGGGPLPASVVVLCLSAVATALVVSWWRRSSAWR
jgi:hypothetical protein